MECIPRGHPPIIDTSADDHYMREALRMARKAASQDEVPIGAIIVHQDKIIARAWNQVETLKDATAHAEMLALTQAEAAMEDWQLTSFNCAHSPVTSPHLKSV